MSRDLIDLSLGIISLVSGALILLNLDSIAQFNQRSGVKLRSWFQRKLGDSILNRELWASGTPGTPSGFRSSRICFQVVAIAFLAGGAVIVALSTR
jgi:hypothetical protein